MYRKRIGITQKLIEHPDYDETMVCLDVNWFSLIKLMGALPVPLPLTIGEANDDILEIPKLDGLIFSGGNSLAKFENKSLKSNKLSSKRDQFEFDLLKFSIKMQYPILGVCRGMQLINTYFDGSCTKVYGHTSTRHTIFETTHQKIQLNHDDVNSFHNYAIPFDGLGSDLLPLAQDCDGNIEAFYHDQSNILGIMWHPERENPVKKADLDLMKRHFEL
jgi:N5-(cytidine 5'-diphosphoramidyl)-L-glutamine hydrolase